MMDNSSNTSNKLFKAAPPPIASLKLEAIFFPKFENETPDSEIRSKMLDRVASHHGYLEASLKHSGSLLLWSGRQCFYSKNATNNKFTKVGEVLLMQHFATFYGVDDNTSSSAAAAASTTTTTDTTTIIWKEEYEGCSEYVYNNRLTCSFEVVTSILGHHGDLPKRDYLILIAVADRRWKNGVGRFYSTNELVKFAHQFRLPHNDIWIFSSRAACESLFDVYDGMRETGTATTVVDRLDSIVTIENDDKDKDNNNMTMIFSTKFMSLYPHLVYQGVILEGIVIRYVPYDRIDNSYVEGGALSNWKDMWEEMKKIADASIELSRLLVSSDGERNDDKLMTTTTTTTLSDFDLIPQVDLRALAEMDDFEEQIENVLREFYGPRRRRIRSKNDVCQPDSERSREMNSIDVVTVAKDILSSSSSIDTSRWYDAETLHIARLIRTLDELKIHAGYKIVMEHTTLADGQTATERYLCILHIHHDSSFAKYNAFLRNQGANGGMMLFRGFSFELVPAEMNQDNHIVEAIAEASDVDTLVCIAESNYASEEKLMLKMKFLPYMVRTFICRNGLGMLQSSGIDAFENYALAQLTKWKVSEESMRKWMPFFHGWARYCSSSQIAVNSDNYLHHIKKFVEQYACGQFHSAPENGSSFRGVIIIVAPPTYDLNALSVGLSRELRCSKVVHGIKNLTVKDCLMSKRSGGLICTAKIEDGPGSLRKLMQQNDAETFTIIMLQSNNAILSCNDGYSKKIMGMTKSWRKTPCKVILDLSMVSVDLSDTDAVIDYLRNNEAAKTMMQQLKESSKSNELDGRPGLIVFFPSIPGSGKSSLCENITTDLAGRNGRRIVLMESDKVKNQAKGKFYNVVANEILSQPSSVTILDKNAPPISFSSVDTLCHESKSIALSVIPIGLVDTYVGHGASSHVYPFPLHFLAACMYHVLCREATSHIGKLDAGTKDACMIVVKFYCLYRNMTVEVLKKKLQKVSYHGQVMQIPYFKERSLPDLPNDFKVSLENAIKLQTATDLRVGNNAKEDLSMATMEETLRASIRNHREFIRNLTTPLEVSRDFFITELSAMIDSLPNTFDLTAIAERPVTRMINIVSLDVDLSEVNTILEKMKNAFPSVRQYFTQREEHRHNDENDKSINRFISSVHVTFAHASKMPQATMLSSFQHLIGVGLQIDAIALLYSEQIAAIEVEIPVDNATPRPMNPFPHITIWCSENSEAYESNNLPEMVKSNQAKKVVLEKPVRLKGVFSFWYNEL